MHSLSVEDTLMNKSMGGPVTEKSGCLHEAYSFTQQWMSGNRLEF